MMHHQVILILSSAIFAFLDEHPIKDAFKFKMPWNTVLPEGYSMFYFDPFLFQNKWFSTFEL